jgi:tetratricopeptide (TPR) repeat protein
MKILALLDGNNPGLLQRLGIEYFNLSQMFTEFADSRQHLLKAMSYLCAVVKLQPDNLAALNYLAQIDYLFGDYPAAISRWQQVVAGLAQGSGRKALTEKVELLKAEGMPEYPLIDDFELIGAAMECYGRGEIDEATTGLNIIEERGRFTTAFSCPEFYYLLGMCRSKNGDQGGAFEALEKALELNPDYALAQEAKDRFLEEGKL